MTKGGFVCFESLGILNFLKSILKSVLDHDFGVLTIYYIDSSKLVQSLLRLLSPILSIKFERLDFKLIDMKDLDGNLLSLKLQHFEFLDIQKDFLKQHSIFESFRTSFPSHKISLYIRKKLATYLDAGNKTIWRSMVLINAVGKKSVDGGHSGWPCLYLSSGIWDELLTAYAYQKHVRLICRWDFYFSFKDFLRSLLGKHRIIFCSFYYILCRVMSGRIVEDIRNVGVKKTSLGKLSVEYYGHLNLNKPHCYSDLFFVTSPLNFKDILLIFHLSKDPLNVDKKNQLDNAGIGYAVFKPDAVKETLAPVFYHVHDRTKFAYPGMASDGQLINKDRWFKDQLDNYSAEYNFWEDFFRSHDIKVYVSWYNLDTSHIVIGDAMAALGGVMALYQRSFQEFPSALTVTNSDIYFGFSNQRIPYHSSSGSHIPYYVSVGYLGDHRFALLKPQAENIRRQLHKAGAKRIVCFLDESSLDDARWHTGHDFMQANYAFILEKLLSDPTLGLVLKPKVPGTLVKRLGPVANVLKQSLETGRVYMFEGGAFHGAYPPAAGALAADIVIHGHLCAGTAGMESALAGVPTLLLDREGWDVSFLSKVGAGTFAFRDWDSLWQACMEFFNAPDNPRKIGDWSPILNDLDPFRDGKAAQRMGTYLHWIMQGFKSGLPRNTVLADAALRYADAWGKDKIKTV